MHTWYMGKHFLVVFIRNFTVLFNKQKLPISKSVYVSSLTERGALFTFRRKCDYVNY